MAIYSQDVFIIQTLQGYSLFVQVNSPQNHRYPRNI